MSTAVSLRLPDLLVEELESVAEDAERSKSYLIRKAVEHYLEDYADLAIVLHRMNDPNDKNISSEEMRNRLALDD